MKINIYLDKGMNVHARPKNVVYEINIDKNVAMINSITATNKAVY